MEQKNPVDGYMDNSLAAIFTMMLPGLGQMLKGSAIPGLIWAVLVGGAYLFDGWIGLALHLGCILDAALAGGMKQFFSTTGLVKKLAFTFSLAILLIYTCMRTALF